MIPICLKSYCLNCTKFVKLILRKIINIVELAISRLRVQVILGGNTA